MNLTGLIARIRVIVTAAPTYLIAAAFVVQVLVEEINLPAVGEYGGRILVLLGTVIAVIRRVAPVVAGERGLLPVPGGLYDNEQGH